jgi:outer membrane protein OmpA-like peptidoglycan-associated protein
LRGENADLNQRAVDDARRLSVYEDVNARLERSVQGYIDEREAMQASFERFKQVARASSSRISASVKARIESFASHQPSTVFDAEAGVVMVGTDVLFVPGTDELKPDASAWLDGFAKILADPEALELAALVEGHGSSSPVRAASTSDPTRTAIELSLTRALKVRDELAHRARRDPSQIGVAGLGISRQRGLTLAAAQPSVASDARIEVVLSPRR